MFDLIVFIGRFQPFHNEHKRVLDKAMEMSKHVLVLVGSAGSARTIKNPFTFNERRDMIRDNYPHYMFEGGNGQVYAKPEFVEPKLIIKPIFDKKYNDTAWVKQVQDTVKKVARNVANPGKAARIFWPNGIADLKIGLIGANKDDSSYYLQLFNNFEFIEMPLDSRMDATDIRREYFTGYEEDFEENVIEKVPTNVAAFLANFEETVQFDILTEEYDEVISYKESWNKAPYPVKQVTVDALVEQSGCILLIRRKFAPGKGLWAIPGGHLEVDERIQTGVIRELREETGLKVPEPVLLGSIVAKEVFDEVNRSTIGRVITHAYHFKLKDNSPLPKIKGEGMDDADKAKWVPLADLKESDFYDDHYHIIQHFLGT